MSVSGKVAVVTGASEGIGKGIALALGKAGVKVAVGARRKDLLDVVVKDIMAIGGRAIAVQTDVTCRDQVKNLVARAEEAFGPVDILVNNAGVFYMTYMKSLREDLWERTIDINCKGVMNGIGAVLDGMVKRQSGHIFNISSDSGREATPMMAVYSGSKFFVEGMSDALRKEVAGYGVKVTCIQPGWVETSGIEVEVEPEINAKMIKHRDYDILTVEDVANAVIYAASQPAHVAINEIRMKPAKYVSDDQLKPDASAGCNIPQPTEDSATVKDSTEHRLDGATGKASINYRLDICDD